MSGTDVSAAPALVASVAKALINLQGKWGTYSGYLDLVSQAVVTLGGMYAVSQVAVCPDPEFQKAVQRFLQAGYLYLGLSVILPILLTKFLEHVQSTGDVPAFVARQFWLKVGAFAILVYLARKAYNARDKCSTVLNPLTVVQSKLLS